MQLFHVIDDAQAILHSKGQYRQVPMYHRGAKVYAKWGASFIRLLGNGCTSHPNVRWDEYELEGGVEDTGRPGQGPVFKQPET